jgi:hypothetical protein
MPAATQLVILLSVGSFQASLPGVSPQPSAAYPDTPQGAREFITWLRPTLPTPKFAAPPMHVCVVGAVPFVPEKAPVLPKPLWESKQPWRSLEPYAATFHYVEADAKEDAKDPKGRAPKARTMKQAQQICAVAAKSVPKDVAIPLVMEPVKPAPRPARP